MNWAMIIGLVLKFLQERYAAGFPLIVALLKLWGIDIQKAADDDTSPITVGAAPEELKDVILGWFQKLKDSTGRPMLKLAIGFIVRYIPGIADQVWDSLFQAGHVAKSASEFTQVVMGTVPQTEAELLAD